jgi:hypothetical protein
VKTKKRKHLRFLIEVSEYEGEYVIISTQLSKIPIPLTEFEKTYSSPFKNKPVTDKNLKQAIEEEKYIQQIAHILHYDVSIKVKKS